MAVVLSLSCYYNSFIIGYHVNSYLGTPTSIIFTQEPDLNQLHVLKDCGNHELVPIVTMPEQVMPEVLENLPQQMLTQPQQTFMPTTMLQSNILTGVYTLTEEPELEVEENTVM